MQFFEDGHTSKKNRQIKNTKGQRIHNIEFKYIYFKPISGLFIKKAD
jgi:DNA-directed RNA polymerase subunit E'/Rpb7